MLVWQAPTRAMNPTVPQAVIDKAFEEDPESASAEFGGEFRGDILAVDADRNICVRHSGDLRAQADAGVSLCRFHRSKRRLLGQHDAGDSA